MTRKQITLYKRRAGTTHAEFNMHWRNKSAPMLGALPGFRASYGHATQNYVLGSGARGDGFPYDGVQECWFRDGVKPFDYEQSAEYLQMVGPDEEEFIDRDSSWTFTADEIEFIPTRSVAKMMIFSHRSHALTPQEYRAYWRNQHVDVLRAHTDFFGAYRGYVQSHIVDGSPRTLTGRLLDDREGFDGLIEIWFDSQDAAQEAFRTTGYTTGVRSDEPNFVAVGQSIAFFAGEHRVLG